MRLNEFFKNSKKSITEESRWDKFSDEQLNKRLSDLEAAYSATKEKTKELLDQLDDFESQIWGLADIAKIAGVSEYDIDNIKDKLHEANSAIYYVEQEVASAINEVQIEIEDRELNRNEPNESSDRSISLKLPKQRDPNWKTMQAKATSGAAGVHRNKKKDMTQGDVKHKQKQFEQGVAEGSLNELAGYGSDKKYKNLGSYKRYNVYVGKQKFNNLYYIAVAENPRTLDAKFKAKGNSAEEALNKLKDEIDKEIDVATKVSGQATLDFNVDFVKDILEMSSSVFYAKIVAGPKLVIAGPEMMEYPEIMRDEGFKASAIRTYKGGEGTTKLPGVPLSAKAASSANLIANGRYVLGSETIDKDGNRVFNLEFDSVVQASNDKMRLRAPAVTIGTNRSQGVAEDENVTKKLRGATPAPAPNPYLKDILIRHIDEVRHFAQTGYFDPTKPLFEELYEYFANEIPESVRRNPARLERRIGDLVAPYAKFYADQKLMNGQGMAEGWDDEEDEEKIVLIKSLKWPELVNKVNSAMKAMGWKGQRKDDGSFMFSTRGQLDDEWYIVVIDNRGNNMFTYALGTVEEGDPYIGEQEALPMTEASVSELMDAIRDGFGLGEASYA
jgi:hypothetical protein